MATGRLALVVHVCGPIYVLTLMVFIVWCPHVYIKLPGDLLFRRFSRNSRSRYRTKVRPLVVSALYKVGSRLYTHG